MEQLHAIYIISLKWMLFLLFLRDSSTKASYKLAIEYHVNILELK